MARVVVTMVAGRVEMAAMVVGVVAVDVVESVLVESRRRFDC